MFDIVFFMAFGWALTWIGIDEMILKSLEQLFDRNLNMLAYYAFFASLGLCSYIYFKFTSIITRD